MAFLRGFVACLSAMLLAFEAAACPISSELPDQTLADHVLGDRVAVLARVDPDNPFRFTIVEVLRGDASDVDSLPPIPFLVSSRTRRMLERQPDHAVLFTYGPDRRFNYGPTRGHFVSAIDFRSPDLDDIWHKSIVVSPDRRRLLERMVAEGAAWRPRQTVDPERVAFFADYLPHADAVTQDLALAEISRAPYAAIRTLGDIASPAALHGRMSNANNIPYAPIAVLLLGASADPDVKAYVRERFQERLRTGGWLLDAWAVAGIEVDGRAAIERIADRLTQPALSAEDRRQLVLALSVAGTALPAWRPAISPVLQDEARAHPESLAEIAYTFLDWKDDSLNAHFMTLLSGTEIDAATRYVLTLAVAAADAPASTEP